MSGQDTIVETEALRLHRTGQLQLVAMVLLAGAFMARYLPQDMVMPALLVLLAAIILLVGYRFVAVGFAGPGTTSDEVVAKLADGYRAQARNGWLLVLIMVGYLTLQTSHLLDVLQSGIAEHRLPPDQFLRNGALSPALTAVLLLVAAVSFAWPLVWLRAAKNRTLETGTAPASRAAAIKFGYLATIALVGAGFVAVWMGMAEPLHVMLWIMLAAVAAPLLLYVALEAR